MKLKKNRFKQFGEISWMVFAMSIVTIGVLAENSFELPLPEVRGFLLH